MNNKIYILVDKIIIYKEIVIGIILVIEEEFEKEL